MISKTANFDALIGDLEGFLNAKPSTTRKSAEDQTPKESNAPSVSSDPEVVTDMLPNGADVVLTSPGDLTMELGVAENEIPAAGLREEKPSQSLVDPSTKLASADPFYSILSSINEESFDGKKIAENATIDEDTALAFGAKLAQFSADREYGTRVADKLLDNMGFGRVQTKTAAQQSFEASLSRKVAELYEAGYNDDQVAYAIRKIAEEDGIAAAQAETSADPSEMAVQEIAALVESGQISEEEAMAAAQEIDGQLGGGGAGPEAGGGSPDAQVQQAIETITGLLESGEISEEEALEAAQEIDAQLGGGGGEAAPAGDPAEQATQVLMQLVESGEISQEEAMEAAQEIDAQLGSEAPEEGETEDVSMQALQELVDSGEITDEYDREAPEVENLDDGRVRVAATMHVDDLAELFEVALEEEEVDTVGGLIAKELGRVPILGSTCEAAGLRLTAERRSSPGSRAWSGGPTPASRP